MLLYIVLIMEENFGCVTAVEMASLLFAQDCPKDQDLLPYQRVFIFWGALNCGIMSNAIIDMDVDIFM